MEVNIRYALEKDLSRIVEILNQGIAMRSVIGYIEALKPEDMKEWFFEHSNDKYPVFIAESDDIVTGWSSISPYRLGRPAFMKTVEISYYVDADYRQRGIGNILLNNALNSTKELGYKTALAIIMDKNIASIKLLEKNSFQKWGVLPDIAEIDGNILSHIYYGRRI